MSALGLGSVIGSLLLARCGLPVILLWTTAIAATQFAVSVAHALPTLLDATFAYGLSTGLFSVSVISTLQMQAAEDMRGRAMALYSICAMGSSPVGVPAFGVLAGWIGISAALRVGACISVAAALTGTVVWQMNHRLRHT